MPAYNEAANLGPMLEKSVQVAESLAGDYEIIVVDDGSRDNTAEVVRQFASAQPRVRLVQHQRNQGYGAAVFTGLTSATKDWVFFTDADRQFKLDELALLLQHTSESELIVGYRSPRRDPPVRLLYAMGWNFLVSLLFGYTVRDIDCAFKLMRREVISTLAPLVRSRGATFSAEWLVMAGRMGYRIVQVPVTHLPRLAGKPTGAKLHVIWRAFRELAAFRLRLWREGTPAHLSPPEHA
jgi:glycosyltransferase involved in cell wall biosynthesis